MIARARPASKRGGDTWSAWAVASAIALVVLVPGVLIVSRRGIGAVGGLSLLVLMGAAAALPAAAGRRGWRVAVPATAGALLLAVAALNAHIFSFEPLPPEPSSGNVAAPVLARTVFLDLGDTSYLDSGFLDRPGLFGGSLPALATLAAVLVLTMIPLSRERPSGQPPAEPS
jgi:hypothetical protein